jgi:hypothetical protein
VGEMGVRAPDAKARLLAAGGMVPGPSRWPQRQLFRLGCKRRQELWNGGGCRIEQGCSCTVALPDAESSDLSPPLQMLCWLMTGTPWLTLACCCIHLMSSGRCDWPPSTVATSSMAAGKLNGPSCALKNCIWARASGKDTQPRIRFLMYTVTFESSVMYIPAWVPVLHVSGDGVASCSGQAPCPELGA